METKVEGVWPQHGDTNPKFFHISPMVRSCPIIIYLRSNCLTNNGSMRGSIGNYFVDQYKSLFTSSNVIFYSGLEGLLNREVTEEENWSNSNPF